MELKSNFIILYNELFSMIFVVYLALYQ